MADDLGDDWWAEKNISKLKKETIKKNESSESKSQKKTVSKKRKADQCQIKKTHKRVKSSEPSNSSGEEDIEKVDEGDSEEEVSNDSKSQSKKTHNRRRITDELTKRGDQPLSPSDLIEALQKHCDGKLTAVELDEMHLDESHFELCNDLNHTPSSFMKTLIPKWQKVMRQMNQIPGSPLLLVVCASAIRSANYIRLISSCKGDDCKVAKLFAKHLKLEDQLKFLRSTVIHVGVGTANRIQSLLESGELHLDQVKYVVLDWSWRDVKQKRMVDIPQVFQDMISLLSKFIIPRVKNSSVKLALL